MHATYPLVVVGVGAGPEPPLGVGRSLQEMGALAGGGTLLLKPTSSKHWEVATYEGTMAFVQETTPFKVQSSVDLYGLDGTVHI